MQLQFIKKLRNLFSIPKNTLFYGVMRPCFRCAYQRRNEPIIIFSKLRGIRILVSNNEAYLREGECVGYEICGRCFEQCFLNDKSLPCKWKKL